MAAIKNTETGAYRSDDATRAEYAARDFSPPFFPFPPDVRVQDAVQPTFNALTQDVVEADPAEVAGVWTQVWSVVDVAADIAAQRLADAKAQAWARIKAERDRRQADGGVEVGGKWFMSSDKEAGRYNLIITAAAAAGAPGTFVMRAAWRTMQDGVTQDMTANLARSIILAGLSQFAAIDDAAQAHKAAMEASADPAAYDSSGGWPAIFGG